MNIRTNYPLKELNTFGINCTAKYFAELNNATQIPGLTETALFRENTKFILGGGSNVLFTQNFEGLIIYPNISSIEVVSENDEQVTLKVGCGVIWDDLVAYTVEKGWGGIENLSLIPGKVGASPVQNIGAYGVEVQEVIESVEGYNLETGQFQTFNNEECRFSYRNSIFKQELSGKFIVTHVTYQLRKTNHVLKTSYGTVAEELKSYASPKISNLREIIIRIREAKLPDPDKTGNAGSFFKNPVLPIKEAMAFREKYPESPIYPAGKDYAKLSAAWLIDKAGCKGIISGSAGTHSTQPLVLVNLGGASGNEILKLAKTIQARIKEKFNIILEPEVNIL